MGSFRKELFSWQEESESSVARLPLLYRNKPCGVLLLISFSIEPIICGIVISIRYLSDGLNQFLPMHVSL